MKTFSKNFYHSQQNFGRRNKNKTRKGGDCYGSKKEGGQESDQEGREKGGKEGYQEGRSEEKSGEESSQEKVIVPFHIDTNTQTKQSASVAVVLFFTPNHRIHFASAGRLISLPVPDEPQLTRSSALIVTGQKNGAASDG